MLEKRKQQQDEGFIKMAFVRKILDEESKEISAEITDRMLKRRFESAGWFAFREMEVTENKMSYKHAPEHRFVDMRTRNTKDGKKRKKSHPVHNRVLYGHMNNIIRRLQFEFTEGMKEQLRNEFKI